MYVHAYKMLLKVMQHWKIPIKAKIQEYLLFFINMASDSETEEK